MLAQLETAELSQFQPFVIALLIGLFIGIERERNYDKGTQAAGVRTFILIATLGAMAAWVGEIAFTAVLSSFVAAAILLAHFFSSQKLHSMDQSKGLTTTMATVIVYALGYMCVNSPVIAVAIAVFVLLTLFSKDSLHTFVRRKLKTGELRATIIILLIGFGVLPFLPHKAIDPWGIFNPQYIAILFLVLSLIQFGGYIAIRVFGRQMGMALMGFFGGLVSSTAVFITLTKNIKDHPELLRAGLAASLLAITGMLIESQLITSIAVPKFLPYLLPPALAMIAFGLIVSIIIIARTKKSTSNAITSSALSNPLNFKVVIKQGIIIFSMIALVSIAKSSLGVNAVHLIAFFGGLFEVHSILLASAALFTEGNASVIDGCTSVGIAIFASFLSKFFMLWLMSSRRFALSCSIALGSMLALGGVIFASLLLA